MTTYVIKTTETIEKVYTIEADSEEELEKYFDGGASCVGILDEETMSSNVHYWKITEVDYD